MQYGVLKQVPQVIASVMLVLTTIVSSAAVARAQEPNPSIMPTVEDGKATLVGTAFNSKERVEITIRVGGTDYQFTVTADVRGRFRLQTQIRVPPGTGLEYEATRADGTGLGGIAEPAPPGTMPQAGFVPISPTPMLLGALVLALGLTLLGLRVVSTLSLIQ